MTAYLAQRLIIALVTLAIASIAVFAILQVLPGDPAQLMLGINANPDTLAALRQEMGLNQPIIERYLIWSGSLLEGDFGRSLTYGAPVSDLILARLTVSLPLALIAIFISTAIALPIGVYAAAHRGTVADNAIMGASQIGIAFPNFWLGLLLVYLFSVMFRLFPSGGFPGWSDPVAGLMALTLPAIALALPQAAILARITRSAMIDVLAEDFIRTARAKGLPQRKVLWRHALRNALIPVVTILGLQFSFLLAGTIIIENVFALPGLGRLIYQAISQRDLIVVQGVVMLVVAAIVIINFIVDIAYALIDPRIRSGM